LVKNAELPLYHLEAFLKHGGLPLVPFIFVASIFCMTTDPTFSFDNTANAFLYKTDNELSKANFIFTLVNNPLVSRMATSSVKMALSLHLPVKGLIRTTVFDHFCGGETIGQCEQTIAKLYKHNVGTILDYSVEGAKTEAGFESTLRELLLTFDKAKANPAIPFCVFKVTGIADIVLLEKVQAKDTLTILEEAAFERVKARVEKICRKAFEFNVPVLIDAEDSWIQDVIDEIAYAMMAKFNGAKAIVFNTLQLYRADMLTKLKHAHEEAKRQAYFLGFKLVRGAYMEKERARAAKLGYADPINVSKEATDALFNKALAYCVENHHDISTVCGSHNEYSNTLLCKLMATHNLAPNDGRIWFAQLLGMSDNISFNLAKAGYNVAKYVPYGPVEAVMPYLLRRAAENTSVAGQSSRELVLIRKELARRRGK
jgi:proline dehydrogenase